MPAFALGETVTVHGQPATVKYCGATSFAAVLMAVARLPATPTRWAFFEVVFFTPATLPTTSP
mgnify:CR=1 FL=1